MLFLLRAVFWTVAVAMLVPGASPGASAKAASETLEYLKADTVQRLARVRAELNARDLQAP